MGERDCKTGLVICIGLAVAVVVAVIVGLLFGFGLVPFVQVGIAIILLLAILDLVFLIRVVARGATCETYALIQCFCRYWVFYLVGIVGTIALCVVCLSIPLNPAAVLDIILVALVALFGTLLGAAFIGLVRCYFCKMCHRPHEG